MGGGDQRGLGSILCASGQRLDHESVLKFHESGRTADDHADHDDDHEDDDHYDHSDHDRDDEHGDDGHDDHDEHADHDDHDEHDGHGDGHDKEVCLSQTSLPKNMPKRRHD